MSKTFHTLLVVSWRTYHECISKETKVNTWCTTPIQCHGISILSLPSCRPIKTRFGSTCDLDVCRSVSCDSRPSAAGRRSMMPTSPRPSGTRQHHWLQHPVNAAGIMFLAPTPSTCLPPSDWLRSARQEPRPCLAVTSGPL